MHRIEYHIKSSAIDWLGVNQFRNLDANNVHVWRANLNASIDEFKEKLHLLSPEERNRADKFHFDKDRMHYVNSRASLRTLLGRYLNKDPRELSFEYTEFGKPYLYENSIQFNVSHSAGEGLFAFTNANSIGIDIEKINSKIEFPKLVKRFFSHNEASLILTLPIEERPNAFFKCWTRKEAFIKAHGEGLSIPLDRFEVSVLQSEVVRLKHVDWKGEIAGNWSLVSFDVKNDYLGALAVRGMVDDISFYTL